MKARNTLQVKGQDIVLSEYMRYVQYVLGVVKGMEDVHT